MYSRLLNAPALFISEDIAFHIKFCPHLEKADTSKAMTHDEHDSSYTKPMELQEEPDSD